jgi:excisionase family DNA binding protein
MTDTSKRLLVTSREAAKMLAVSTRTVWALTSPRGPLSSVRLGRAVRYSVADLDAFIQAARTEGKK